MFGEKWNRPYGEWDDKNPTIGIWGAALRGLTPEQIDTGLEAVSNSGGKFIPTAPEFKEFCTGPKEHWEHAQMRKAQREYVEGQKRLEHKKINKDVGRKHLSQINEMLRKGKDDAK